MSPSRNLTALSCLPLAFMLVASGAQLTESQVPPYEPFVATVWRVPSSASTTDSVSFSVPALPFGEFVTSVFGFFRDLTRAERANLQSFYNRHVTLKRRRVL